VSGITTREIKEMLTEENIITLLKELGSETHLTDRQNNLIFKTVCHGGNSYKLYYYVESKIFKCYTQCNDGSFDVFGLVMKTKGISFQESLIYICRLFDFKIFGEGFSTTNKLTSDWDIIEKYNFLKLKEDVEKVEHPLYDENILNYFTQGLHETWVADGIDHTAGAKFGIRCDNAVNNRIIIPHRDITGNLIGIRVRNLETRMVESGVKYMPLILQEKIYTHSIGSNLYGIYENLESIKKYGKIVLFEAEKSVLQCETFYPNNSFAVATCGSSITTAQREIILSLGIKEVFIAFDKQYQEVGSEEEIKYAKKIRSLAQKFSPYLTTYVLWDNLGDIGYKDSPSDKGRDILEKIMKNKFEIGCEE